MLIAYFDCFSGASGDMLLGALVDAGMNPKLLGRTISALGLDKECSIETERVIKNGISATRVLVRLNSKESPPRNFSDIKMLIEASELSDSVKARAISVFKRLAKTEAKIHGCLAEEVHFHEVGAVDSIVDIVGVIAGLEALGVDNVFASSLPLGYGTIQTQHGCLPLPSPATIELLKGVPVYDSGVKAEMVTPTGAALLTELANHFGPFPAMKIHNVGYGAGARDIPGRPNVIRVIMGREVSAEDSTLETIGVLQTSIDDTSPELMGFLLERLFEEGALDVTFFPVQMKKNRPGVHVEVMVHPYDMDRISDIIFGETTTLGIRFRVEERKILKRRDITISTPWGRTRAKVVERGGSALIVPEYEECKRIAKDHKIPLKDVYAWFQSQRDITPV